MESSMLLAYEDSPAFVQARSGRTLERAMFLAELREAIESGTYRPGDHDVAAALVARIQRGVAAAR